MNDGRLSRCHSAVVSEMLKRYPRFVRIKFMNPIIIRHQSVNSVIDSENVPASFEIAETRCPGVQRYTCIIFGGSSVPVFDVTAVSVVLIIAIRQPPVEDAEPG